MVSRTLFGSDTSVRSAPWCDGCGEDAPSPRAAFGSDDSQAVDAPVDDVPSTAESVEDDLVEDAPADERSELVREFEQREREFLIECERLEREATERGLAKGRSQAAEEGAAVRVREAESAKLLAELFEAAQSRLADRAVQVALEVAESVFREAFDDPDRTARLAQSALELTRGLDRPVLSVSPGLAEHLSAALIPHWGALRVVEDVSIETGCVLEAGQLRVDCSLARQIAGLRKAAAEVVVASD